MAAQVLELNKTINATKEKVFEAWSRPEFMQKWFHPEFNKDSEVKNEFKVGGEYTLLMKGDENDHLHTGEYKQIDPTDLIAFTWNSPKVSDTLVTIRLTEENGKTNVNLTHEFLETQELRDMHNGGWTGCLNNLFNFFQ